jgi:hypothetical protein
MSRVNMDYNSDFFKKINFYFQQFNFFKFKILSNCMFFYRKIELKSEDEIMHFNCMFFFFYLIVCFFIERLN